MLCTEKVHGDFITDRFFGKVAWDEELRIVCYGAEAKSPSEKTPWSYEHKLSWGETLSSRVDPQIICLDLTTATIEQAPCSGDFSPSSPSILPNGDIAFVGYAKAPTKLGLFYCYNRHSQIFLWKRREKRVESFYSDPAFAVRSLHYSHGKLYFLRSVVGGSHFAASELCHIETDTPGNVTILLKDVFTEGIDVDASRNMIYFNTPIRSIRRYHVLDGATGKSWEPDGERLEDHSESILDCRFGWALIQRSSPISPPTLQIRRVWETSPSAVEVKYTALLQTPELLKTATYNVIPLSDFAEYILLKPSQPNGSLVVFIHGGPNSVYPTEWNLFSANFVALGYTVITVNYAGSIGFGQSGIEALEGNIGERDIADVINAIDNLEIRMKKFQKVILFGGSHGGYISSMLSGKYPERFTACIMRNPVVDLPSMSYATDILDWTFGQMGLKFSLSQPMPASEDQLMKLYRHSPSAYVQNVRVPTLVIVGEKDLRVPPFQGKIWYTWLKSLGVSVRLVTFPDAGHALDSPVAEKNSLLVINDFLNSLS